TTPPPTSPLFPYTTLFRSRLGQIVTPAWVSKTASASQATKAAKHSWIAALSVASSADHVCELVISMTADHVAPTIGACARPTIRSEEHTSELQSRENLVCR